MLDWVGFCGTHRKRGLVRISPIPLVAAHPPPDTCRPPRKATPSSRRPRMVDTRLPHVNVLLRAAALTRSDRWWFPTRWLTHPHTHSPRRLCTRKVDACTASSPRTLLLQRMQVRPAIATRRGVMATSGAGRRRGLPPCLASLPRVLLVPRAQVRPAADCQIRFLSAHRRGPLLLVLHRIGEREEEENGGTSGGVQR